MTYDPAIVDYKDLLAGAKKMNCTSAIYTYNNTQKQAVANAGLSNVQLDWRDSLETRQVRKSEQKYYLRNTAYGYLPLTEYQAVKLNVAASPKNVKKLDPASLLSPRQTQLLQRIVQALNKDPQALSGFGFPENQDQLASYEAQLVERLDRLER